MSLSKHSQANLREIFNLADIDLDGSLTITEFKKLAKSVGLNLTKTQLNILMKEADLDNSGQISFEEFLNVMGKEMNPDKVSINDAAAIFGSFSRAFTPKGFILLEDLNHVLLNVLKLDHNEVRSLLKDLEPSIITLEQTNREGMKSYLNYGEFLSFMNIKS